MDHDKDGQPSNNVVGYKTCQLPQCYQLMDQLRIETYGGETAGSGYNWVTEFTDEGMNLDAIRQAQETGIAMIRSCIKITQEELLRTRQDEQMLTEFIAESYEEEFNVDRSKYKFAVLVKEVKDLEEEISSLQMLSPHCVPLIRPSLPDQTVNWKCLRCLEENDLQSYRCQCLFPRLEIDPIEAQNCCCSICSKKSMPSIVEQLIDMGFAKERAEKAYSLAGDSLEAAMDWLISHEDDDIVVSTEKESVEMDSKVVVNEHIQGSYKCNDCNELFRDENGMMWHNIKSGHESFSETTETITPLTPEELEQKSTELRKRIRTARAQREENERKEQIEKERRRREEGKKMMETREKQKEMELRAIADERKRAKQEEIAARQRVLDQIKADKEARKTRDCGKQDPHVISSIPVHIAVPSNNNYNEAMIQIRLPNGQAVKHTFGAMEPLSAVRVWLQVNHSDGSPFSLLVPFPRRVITEDDYDKPLKELGLVPSASLVMTR